MSLFIPSLIPALDDNGEVINGAEWFFYQSETLTPVAVYSDGESSVSLGTSVTCDSSGRFVPIYLNPAVVYRAILKGADGATISPWDVDPYIQTVTQPELIADTGAASIGTAIGDDLQTVLDDYEDRITTVTASIGAGVLKQVSTSLLPTGVIPLPVEFNNTLDAVPYWDGTTVQYEQTPYDLIDFELFGNATQYYVNWTTGSDSDDGLSSANAFKTLTYALATATSPAVINLEDDYVGSGGFAPNPALTVNGKFKIKGKATRTRIYARREAEVKATFSWAASGANGAYVSTTSAARFYRGQFDANFLDAKGIPRPITNAGSVAACQAAAGAGTYYWDAAASDLYVHMWDGREPDPDDGWIYHEASNYYQIQQTATTNAGVLLYENLEFMANVGAVDVNANIRYRPVSTGSPNGTIVGFKNCLSYGSSGNGFQIYDADVVVYEDCHTAYNHVDGFNYHSFITADPDGEWITVYEHNCTIRHSGFNSFADQTALGTSCNGSSAHNSIHILRTNTVASDCNGGIIADVNGSVSINLNVQASRPGDTASPNACFWHDDYAGAGTYTGMWLWGCSAFDDDDATVSLLDNTAQGGGATGQIYVKYWRGQTDGTLVGTVKDFDGQPLV